MSALKELTDAIAMQEVLTKYRPSVVKVGSLDAFSAALEKEIGPLISDAKATGDTFMGLPVVTHPALPKNGWVIMQGDTIIAMGMLP